MGIRRAFGRHSRQGWKFFYSSIKAHLVEMPIWQRVLRDSCRQSEMIRPTNQQVGTALDLKWRRNHGLGIFSENKLAIF